MTMSYLRILQRAYDKPPIIVVPNNAISTAGKLEHLTAFMAANETGVVSVYAYTKKVGIHYPYIRNWVEQLLKGSLGVAETSLVEFYTARQLKKEVKHV